MKEELGLLATPLQDWVQSKKWDEFRPIQREAIKAILSNTSGENDFILSATTASGKTEAAFLPLLTRLYERDEQARPSYEILYLSPLKALINDMNKRVRILAGRVGRRTYRRHGDIPTSERAEGERHSRGILLTTPESLEAQFIRSPHNLAFVFKDLLAVIVDEIHAYFESPRGPQVISLLTRLEELLAQEHKRSEYRIQRIALSATVSGRDRQGEKDIRTFLRPEDPKRVKILCSEEAENPTVIHLKVLRDVKNVRNSLPKTAQIQQAFVRTPGDINLPDLPIAIGKITRSLFDVFAECNKGLVFTNSRREAEDFANLLNQQARETGVVQEPKSDNEFSPETRRFWPHHGSLDSSIRSRAEKTMRDQDTKSVLVCTTTLELGIDIGSVGATAQIGPGYSVASLRQRLGRSGRREGMVPTLYAYVRESNFSEDVHPLEKLHLQTFRTLAQIDLLKKDAFEPPDLQRFNLSTLIQQLLSCVHQYQDEEGLDPELARVLLVERGPFRSAEALLQPLIEHLSKRYNPLIEKQNGRLFLTERGKKYVEHYTFYAAFHTPKEYVVQAGARRIGAFATRYPYGPGDQFLFAGAFWQVIRVDHTRRVMEVTRTSSGRAPNFQGDALAPSDLVVQEMRRLYQSNDAPVLPRRYTNSTAREAIELGRRTYRELFRERSHVIEHKGDILLFPWVGTRKQITLVSALKWMGLSASAMDIAAIVSDTSRTQVLEILKRLQNHPLPSEHDLSRYVSKLTFEKHDYLLSPALKRMNFASAKLDVQSLPSTIERLLGDDEISA